MKFTELVKSKKFWTLVTAIIAALAAFFTVSCSSKVVVSRSGVHIDTVRTGVIYRTNNYKDI